ncbi:hypothetical protein [Arenibaculum pallidiluteum]|uniref:hypothetical protein n=1 Tax=Arenibaculum pallidiluteum TaxID=2812559 RepID=UPI001F34A655|nr:hypothetical protein [Arenibaculum pallidiluteum]
MLPLVTVPLATPGLRRAHLIKNSRLQTVVEIFRADGPGSGQVEIEQVPNLFPGDADGLGADMPILRQLASINSFDVFTLRVELRSRGIAVEDHEMLTLSKRKRAELTEAMRDFTRPLILQVYGSDDREITDVGDILRMFAHPDREEALRNLRRLSERLQIELAEIPRFLEDYGDVFLSLAYFRQCLDQVVPEIHRFQAWVGEALKVQQIAADIGVVRQIGEANRDIGDITGSLTGRFESFDRRSRDFWADINAETFRQLRELIQAHHATIGGVLCGLVLKMDLWRERFPEGKGGPLKRVEFFRSEVLPGLSRIKDIEREAARSLRQAA